MPDSPPPATNCEEALVQLKKFGYAFDGAGVLRKIDPATGEPGKEPFSYNVSDDPAENEKHYQNLANQIPEIVYALLEKNGLSRTYIPFNNPPERSSFIYSQPAKLSQSKKLLVLIHGSGYVKAGQWARSLIINNSLDHGSQLPYVRQAQKLGYDLLITNANDCKRFYNGKDNPIKEVDTPIDHTRYVWKNIVLPSKPESVAIVAHSYGGCLTLDLVDRYSDFFKESVFAIAFTDAVMGSPQAKNKDYLCDVTCDWVASNSPLDTPVSQSKNGIRKISAGHTKHEWTSYSAIDSVFKFIEEKYEQRSNKK
ncbi:LOW QUALITY PROTEIN: FAM172 family protein homolog CG10038 [Drosophila ficusphila]|uniref:LOW QUALITY PROTEIN: FAM172 family protein homolog CG10038 n=1 Tax=Drosophila ficusphila TaxID=30025 RepID=UPI0007E7CBE4|nr:LOW QUALITY PROTEIN: FAM172 family protein homolog CG10038 [Drosophila ficusphila]